MPDGLGVKTLQEYLVSLGVKLDEKNMVKMEGFLKSAKLGFVALAGVMVAGATVATKWINQMNETELALQKQAKAQHKSIESVRASENALKAMGKTRQEIAKDKSLKAVYDDLVKMNKAMALPDGSRGLTLIKTIVSEFYKFKSTVQYAMQWVNYHIISKLEGPLTRIRDTMQKWRENLTAEMPLWTAKIANGIAVLVRLLETAVTFGGKVLKFINDLPDSVKVAGTAIAGFWSIIRAGPLGWLLGGLTMLMLLLDDFYAYKRGEPSALAGLWEGLDDGTFGDKIVGIVSKGIDSVVRFMKSPEVQSALSEVVNVLLSVVSQIIDGAVAILMNSLPKNIQDFLGWDTGTNDGKGGWKLDERDVEVESKDNKTVVKQGETAPSIFDGIDYQNTNGIMNPVLSSEYRNMPLDQVPQKIIDGLNHLAENFWKGSPPLYKTPDYEVEQPSTDEISKRETEVSSMLKNMLDGKESDEELSHSDFYKNLKIAYSTEQNRLGNGEITQEHFDKMVSALVTGAAKDYRASQSPYGTSFNGYQFNQWYEAYKNGTLLPHDNSNPERGPDGDAEVYYMPPKTLSKSDYATAEYGIDGDIEVHYDPIQVSQATKKATDVAQESANPIYVPLIPEYGADGDVEVRYDPNGGKKRNALGGRYDKPTETTLVEDGDTEYVIPIRKLDRAIPLIRMMLSEIGQKGRDMLSGLGITPDTDINALVASKGLGMPGGGGPSVNIVNNYTNTVTAPSTINVYGAGQDAQAVGQAAYNAQERFLVRTLKGAIPLE